MRAAKGSTKGQVKEKPRQNIVFDPKAAAALLELKGKGRSKGRRNPIVADAAAALLEAEPLKFLDIYGDEIEEDVQENTWREYNGEALEPALTVVPEIGESPVRLVDARFIVELANRDGRLPRRQDLPEEVFVPLEQLKRFPPGGRYGDCLRIISISHPWQQPEHPDPKSINLKTLANVLSVFLKHSGGTYAVFLDFMSVSQRGAHLQDRTRQQQALFVAALRDVMNWYAHPKTLTLKFTKLPEDYPKGFFGANVASYFERGWCFCESSVCSFVKDRRLVLDLDNFSGAENINDLMLECMARRLPPLMPEDFHVELDKKQFSNKVADFNNLSKQYACAFEDQMSAATELRFALLGWGDSEVGILAKACGSGLLENLKSLDLQQNMIGDAGCKMLTEACAGLPNLVVLDLRINKIGGAGCTALAQACAAGTLSNLEELHLSENQIGDAGCAGLAQACIKGALPNLTMLFLSRTKEHLSTVIDWRQWLHCSCRGL